MDIQRHTLTHKELWVRCDAAGVVYSTTTAKGATQPKAPSAQPDYPRTLRFVTDSFTSDTAVTATVTGTDRFGNTITEDFAIPANGDPVNGSKAFTKITSFTWTTPSGWSAGTIQLVSGAKLGLNLPEQALNVAARKENAADETASPPNPTHAEPGTVDATNMTYTPTTALAAGTTIGAWFTYTLHQNLNP